MSGLTSEEAAEKLKQFGFNEIVREKPRASWKQFLAQLSNVTVLLLISAGIISLLLGEYADSIAIFAIVVTNAAVGFFQEYRAERALLALRSLAAPKAKVLRNGRPVVIPATEIVPGDVLLLEAGDRVAADASLIQAFSLKTNEALLTGESLPVDKTEAAAGAKDRQSELFMGTTVVNGTAQAGVTATGMKTELGKIAHLLSQVKEEITPLQKKIGLVGHALLYVCLSIVAVTAAITWLRGLPLSEVFLSSVSLAIAGVPEGLPAIVTIALAIGVQRMVARNVLVRKLPSVETLGCATVICTDKTGTLTTGVMAVRETWGPDPHKLLYTATACSNADLGSQGQALGDPTEIAILLAAAERGIHKEEIERKNPKVHEIPFDSNRKRMSIARTDGVLYVKGALESLLPLVKQKPENIENVAEDMAHRGLRVLAVALGSGREEQNLEFLGLLGIADPPRKEAIEAVAAARRAGIRTVMITGDHPITARAIAKEMGIWGAEDQAMEVVQARVTPEDKLRIIRDWKQRGEIVAMTGDGVNDAPALREAHIGIAMGKGGTEVAREAADMVLLDDNFASIIAAVREGRGIYDNIRKTLVYLLSGNMAELSVMLGAAIFGVPAPFLPLQLLWINLVTDSFPALALVMDPTDPSVLQRPPRHPKERILSKRQWRTIAYSGFLLTSVTLPIFLWTLEKQGLSAARNMAFSVMVFGHLLPALAFRSEHRLFWEVGVFGNIKLLAVILVSVFLQIALPYLPFLSGMIGAHSMEIRDYLIAFGLALIPVSVLEITKLIRRSRLPALDLDSRTLEKVFLPSPRDERKSQRTGR